MQVLECELSTYQTTFPSSNNLILDFFWPDNYSAKTQHATLREESSTLAFFLVEQLAV